MQQKSCEVGRIDIEDPRADEERDCNAAGEVGDRFEAECHGACSLITHNVRICETDRELLESSCEVSNQCLLEAEERRPW